MTNYKLDKLTQQQAIFMEKLSPLRLQVKNLFYHFHLRCVELNHAPRPEPHTQFAYDLFRIRYLLMKFFRFYYYYRYKINCIMRMNTKVRYGLRAMIEIGSKEQTSGILQKEISEIQEIPLRYLDSIITDLRNAGLIVNFSGNFIQRSR